MKTVCFHIMDRAAAPLLRAAGLLLSCIFLLPVMNAQPASTNAPAQLQTATFGGGFTGRATTGNVLFSGLTPTAVGLYQVNVTVPSDSPLGALVPVTLLVNGVQSNPVYLAVSASGQ